MSCFDTSGTSSANTTASPLKCSDGQHRKVDENKDDVRIQVPVDVTVTKPWARVVGEEPNSYTVSRAGASAHDIAEDRVFKVVCPASSTPKYVEGMLVRGILASEQVGGAHI